MKVKYGTIGLVVGLFLSIVLIAGLSNVVDSSVYCSKYPSRCAQGEMLDNDMFSWLQNNPFPFGGNNALIAIAFLLPILVGLSLDYKKHKDNASRALAP